MFLLMLLLACGVIGAVLAQSKNRSPFLGGVVGVAGGPVGVLLIALLGKVEQTEAA